MNDLLAGLPGGLGGVSMGVWFAAAYGAFLVLAAHGVDLVARRTAANTDRWHSGAFVYHEDHDAWLCPQDQWLWPQSFDPENRVMRYRASPAVCNSCPVKESCTTTSHGRELSRNVDPWPSSEAERFHRGIACAISVLAVVWPLGALFQAVGAVDRAVLAVTVAVVALGSWPLWAHLRRTPAAFPEGVKIERPDEAAAARAVAAAREQRRRSGYRSDREVDADLSSEVQVPKSRRLAS
jgi:hypothetical protein